MGGREGNVLRDHTLLLPCGNFFPTVITLIALKLHNWGCGFVFFFAPPTPLLLIFFCTPLQVY